MRTQEMRTLESSLGVAAGAIQAELDTLSSHLDVLSSQWSGEAFVAYTRAQTQWVETMGEMSRLLSAASDATGVATTRHLESRGKVAALWRR